MDSSKPILNFFYKKVFLNRKVYKFVFTQFYYGTLPIYYTLTSHYGVNTPLPSDLETRDGKLKGGLNFTFWVLILIVVTLIFTYFNIYSPTLNLIFNDQLGPARLALFETSSLPPHLIPYLEPLL